MTFHDMNSARLARAHKREAIDLLLSTSSAAAKGIRPPPGVPHLCYCHSPARYLWSQTAQYEAGRRFLRGDADNEDLAKGIKYCEAAVAREHWGAMLELGRAFEDQDQEILEELADFLNFDAAFWKATGESKTARMYRKESNQ